MTSSDEELLEYRGYCQTWLSQKITYQFYDGTYQVSTNKKKKTWPTRKLVLKLSTDVTNGCHNITNCC